MVYLYLFHGRRDPKENLDNWGENGPVLGPLDYVHTTYGSCVKWGYGQREKEGHFTIVDDLLYYDGMYYGDWSVTTEIDLNAVQQIDVTKLEPPPAPPPAPTHLRANPLGTRHYRRFRYTCDLVLPEGLVAASTERNEFFTNTQVLRAHLDRWCVSGPRGGSWRYYETPEQKRSNDQEPLLPWDFIYPYSTALRYGTQQHDYEMVDFADYCKRKYGKHPLL